MTRQENRRAARLRKLEETHLERSLYWSNRAVVLAQYAEDKLARKLANLCRRCPAKAAGDIGVCRRCAAIDRRKARVRMRRLRARERRLERQLAAKYRPMDEIVDLTRVRILRAARWLDWFSGYELNEMLGAESDAQRNKQTQHLVRMTREGLFQRRKAEAGTVGSGSNLEYLVTAVGIAELDDILGGKRVPVMRSKRAA